MAAVATAGQRAAAERLRTKGNSLFGRGKYAAAADIYTEAITLDPGNAALFVNRALCAKKQGAEGCWARVAADAQSALALDGQHMKALYLAGVALRELGDDPKRAISHLERALERAREKDDGIKDEIWRELAKANDAAWRAESVQRLKETEALRHQLQALAQAARAASASLTGPAAAARPAGAAAEEEGAAASSSLLQRERGSSDVWTDASSESLGRGNTDRKCSVDACTPGSELAARPGQAGAPAAEAAAAAVDWEALGRVFERAVHADTPGEVPSAFTCPLTMEVFRDPVTSKNGHTYERAALLEHLTKVGAWDPITRVPMTLADVRPNIAMRGAVSLYLQEHGWAWHECY